MFVLCCTRHSCVCSYFACGATHVVQAPDMFWKVGWRRGSFVLRDACNTHSQVHFVVSLPAPTTTTRRHMRTCAACVVFVLCCTHLYRVCVLFRARGRCAHGNKLSGQTQSTLQPLQPKGPTTVSNTPPPRARSQPPLVSPARGFRGLTHSKRHCSHVSALKQPLRTL